MKNLFGIENNKENIDGESFIIRRISPDIEKEISANSEKEEHFEKKASLPKLFAIIEWISLIIGLLLLSGIFDALENVTIKEAFNNAPYIFIATIILLTTFLILFLIEKHLNCKIKKDKDYIDFTLNTEELINKAFNDLEVPINAKEIDVFIYPYKMKKEKETSSTDLFKYINSKHKVFIENNNLCFATPFEVVSIPIKSIIKIKEINKKSLVFGWNKQEKFNQGEYKKYNIKSTQYDTLIIKPYYSIQISDYYGEFEVLIPCYDINIILELINISIEKEDNK